jgi:hypothetical protein
VVPWKELSSMLLLLLIPLFLSAVAVEAFAETVRRVLSTAVVELENKWTELQCTAGEALGVTSV